MDITVCSLILTPFKESESNEFKTKQIRLCDSMNLYRYLDSSTVSCGEETAGFFTRRRHYTSQPISKREQDSHN